MAEGVVHSLAGGGTSSEAGANLDDEQQYTRPHELLDLRPSGLSSVKIKTSEMPAEPTECKELRRVSRGQSQPGKRLSGMIIEKS